MKVGILSLKYTSNYGGILQSYALQETLKKECEYVEIINYKSTHKDSILHNLIFRFTNLLFSGNIINSIRDRKKESIKIKRQDPQELIENNEQFMSRYLNRREEVSEDNISEYCKKFDCIIVGSDQIWTVTNSSILTFFFDWSFTGKKIAYAACSVYRRPAILNSRKIMKLLKKFKMITKCYT